MKKIIGIAACVTMVFLSGCTMSKSKDISIAFKELSYGVISVGGTSVTEDDDDKSPSGNTVSHSKMSITEKTDTITGEIGRVFGVNFVLLSNINAYFPVTRRWTFPSKIGAPGGEQVGSVTREDGIVTNTKQWMYYTFEEDYEIVKGKWVLQYFYKNQEIYKKTFVVQ